MNYGYKKKMNLEFDEAVGRVREELKKEGFGVLTEVDVKETLKKKLDVDFDNYLILGACNPGFAYKALEAEIDIGLLLPCNVIVYERKGETYVAAINPVEAMSMIENEELRKIAFEIRGKLQKVVDSFVEIKGGDKNGSEIE